ncbi:hypothetical protein AAY473_015487 [Plecturocebus cupreus]
MGPAEPVRPVYSTPGSAALGHRQNSRTSQKSRTGDPCVSSAGNLPTPESTNSLHHTPRKTADIQHRPMKAAERGTVPCKVTGAELPKVVGAHLWHQRDLNFSFGGRPFPHRAGPSRVQLCFSVLSTSNCCSPCGDGTSGARLKGRPVRTLRTEKRRAGQKSRAGDPCGSLAGNLAVRGHQIFVCNCSVHSLSAPSPRATIPSCCYAAILDLSSPGDEVFRFLSFPLADAGSPQSQTFPGSLCLL